MTDHSHKADSPTHEEHADAQLEKELPQALLPNVFGEDGCRAASQLYSNVMAEFGNGHKIDFQWVNEDETFILSVSPRLLEAEKFKLGGLISSASASVWVLKLLPWEENGNFVISLRGCAFI